MSKWNILVIDDEVKGANSRKKVYKLLEKESIDGVPVSITFAASLVDSQEKITKERYHLVLIDVVLKDWGDENGEGFEMLLKAASEHMPVAIVSSQWDASSIPYVRKALTNNQGCDIRLLLRWRDLETKETRGLVALQLQKEIYRHYGYSPLNKRNDDSLRILHLSDLHFRSKKDTLVGAEQGRVIDKILSHWDGGPDLVVCTGDVANTGNPNEYQDAIEWFRELTSQFEWDLPCSRILLVPGNHDCSVPLGASRQIHIVEDGKIEYNNKTDESSLALSVFAMAPFQEFAQKLTGRSEAWRYAPFEYWLDASYRHHGVVFTGFNTSREVVKDGWTKRKIDIESITRIEKEIKKLRKNEKSPLIHISLSHHSPVQLDAEQPIENSGEYRTHLVKTKGSPHIVFHGHEHKRAVKIYDGKVLVIAAPTPTQREENRPPDNARGFTLVELIRDGLTLRGTKVITYILDSDRWAALPAECYKYSDESGFQEIANCDELE